MDEGHRELRVGEELLYVVGFGEDQCTTHVSPRPWRLLSQTMLTVPGEAKPCFRRTRYVRI